MFGASDPASHKTVNIRPISKFSPVSANSCKIHCDLQTWKNPKTFIFTKIQPHQTQTKWWLILASVTPLATKSHKSLFWWQKTYIITVRRIPKPKTQICSTVLLEPSTKIHLDFKFWRTHTKTSHYFHFTLSMFSAWTAPMDDVEKSSYSCCLCCVWEFTLVPSWTDWIFGNIIGGGRGGPLLVLYTHTILVRTRVILTAAS